MQSVKWIENASLGGSGSGGDYVKNSPETQYVVLRSGDSRPASGARRRGSGASSGLASPTGSGVGGLYSGSIDG